MGRSSSSKRSSNRATSISSRESGNGRGSMSNVCNNSTGGSSINTSEKTSTNTISSSIGIRKNSWGGCYNSRFLISITSLPFFGSWFFWGSSSGGGSSIISSSKFSLSSSNLRSVLDSNWEGEVENWSSKRS